MAVQPQETNGAHTPESNPVFSQAQRNVSEVMFRLQDQGLSVGKGASAQQSNERFFTETLGMERSQFTSGSDNVYSFQDIQQAFTDWSEGKSVSDKYQHIIHTILKRFLPDSFAKLSDDAAIQKKFGSIQKIIFAPTSKSERGGRKRVVDMLTPGQESPVVDQAPTLQAEFTQVPPSESGEPVSTEQVTAQQAEQVTTEGLTPVESANFDFFLGTLPPLVIEHYGGEQTLRAAYTQWLSGDAKTEVSPPVDQLFREMIYLMLDEDGQAALDSGEVAVKLYAQDGSIATDITDPAYIEENGDKAWTQESVQRQLEEPLLYSTPELRLRLFQQNITMMTDSFPPVMARRVHVTQLRTALQEYAQQLANDKVWMQPNLTVEERINILRQKAQKKAKALLQKVTPIEEDWRNVFLGPKSAFEQIDDLVWWLVAQQSGALFTLEALQARFRDYFAVREVLEERDKGMGRRVVELFGVKERPTQVVAKYNPDEHPLYQGDRVSPDEPLIRLPKPNPSHDRASWQAHIDFIVHEKFRAHLGYEESMRNKSLQDGRELSDKEYWDLHQEAVADLFTLVAGAEAMVVELSDRDAQYSKTDRVTLEGDQLEKMRKPIIKILSQLKTVLGKLSAELNPRGVSRNGARDSVLPGWSTELDRFGSMTETEMWKELAHLKSLVETLSSLSRESVQQRVLDRNQSAYMLRLLEPMNGAFPSNIVARMLAGDRMQRQRFNAFIDENQSELHKLLFGSSSLTRTFQTSIRPLVEVEMRRNGEQEAGSVLQQLMLQQTEWVALSKSLVPELQGIRDWFEQLPEELLRDQQISQQIRSVQGFVDALKEPLPSADKLIPLHQLHSENRYYRIPQKNQKDRMLNLVGMLTELSGALQQLVVAIAEVSAREAALDKLGQQTQYSPQQIQALEDLGGQVTRVKHYLDKQLLYQVKQFSEQIDVHVAQARKDNRVRKQESQAIISRLHMIEQALRSIEKQTRLAEDLITSVEQSADRRVGVSPDSMLLHIWQAWVSEVQPSIQKDTDQVLQTELLPDEADGEAEE